MDDLSVFDTKEAASEGQEMIIFKPDLSGPFLDENGKPWSITVRGSDSSEYRSARSRMKRKIWEKSVIGESVDDAQIDDEVAVVMAACVIGWAGIRIDGEDFPFSRDNAVTLLQRFPWLLDRVSDFVENRANFMKPLSKFSESGSAKTSSSDAPARAARKARKQPGKNTGQPSSA